MGRLASAAPDAHTHAALALSPSARTATEEAKVWHRSSRSRLEQVVAIQRQAEW